MAAEDWRAIVSSLPCEAFASLYAHPFLLSLSGIVAPPPPPRTVPLEETTQVAALHAERRRRITPADRAPAVLPVRKSQPSFESMITVGRGGANDIVVPDATVSKYHAFFRCADGQWWIADAGSINGTTVGAAELVPKGPAWPLSSGDELTFGDQRFRFLDAATLWASLH